MAFTFAPLEPLANLLASSSGSPIHQAVKGTLLVVPGWAFFHDVRTPTAAVWLLTPKTSRYTRAAPFSLDIPRHIH